MFLNSCFKPSKIRKNCILQVLLVVFLFTGVLRAETQKTPQTKPHSKEQPKEQSKPSRFDISHFNHPALPPFIELIGNVYSGLGIKPHFAEVPAARGFTELDSGRFDADVLRVRKNAERFANILVVQPAIIIGELLLICPAARECKREVLASSDTIVISNVNNQWILRSLNLQASIINNENNDVESFLGMLRKGRADYVIYGSVKGFKESLGEEFKTISLLKLELHHVVHASHAELLPDIERELKAQLAKLPADYFKFEF